MRTYHTLMIFLAYSYIAVTYETLFEHSPLVAPSFLGGGILSQYDKPEAPYYNLMPYANCPNKCVASRCIYGVEDCSKCTIYRLMPPTECAQCNGDTPCKKCAAFKLMPVNECNARYKTYGEPTPEPTTFSKTTKAPSTTATTTTTTTTTKAPATHPTPAPTTPAPETTKAHVQTTTQTPKPVHTTQTPKPEPTTKHPTSEPKSGKTTQPTAVPSSQKTGTGAGGAQLGAGAIAGIVIACVAVVALAGFVTWKKLKDKEREEQMFGEPAELENPDSSSDYAAM